MARDRNQTIYRILVDDIYDVAESNDRDTADLTDDVVERVIHKIEAMSFEDLAESIDMFIDDAIRESKAES